jgi:hypothetical protein
MFFLSFQGICELGASNIFETIGTQKAGQINDEYPKFLISLLEFWRKILTPPVNEVKVTATVAASG